MSLYKYKRKNINDAFSRTKFRNDHYILGVWGGGGDFFLQKNMSPKFMERKLSDPKDVKYLIISVSSFQQTFCQIVKKNYRCFIMNKYKHTTLVNDLSLFTLV